MFITYHLKSCYHKSIRVEQMTKCHSLVQRLCFFDLIPMEEAIFGEVLHNGVLHVFVF